MNPEKPFQLNNKPILPPAALLRGESSEFVDHILQIEGGKPSAQSFNLLFDMVNDASSMLWEGTDGRLDFLHVFWGLLKKVELKTQMAMLKKLHDLLAVSTRVKQQISQQGWILKLLEKASDVENETLLVPIFDLIQLLSNFSISAKELKWMFLTLQQTTSTAVSQRGGNCKPPFWLLLTEIFSKISKREGPDVYFDLNGGLDSKEPGLMLPNTTWTAGSGYTFFAWLRIESFEDPTRRPDWRPTLYSLQTEDGLGVEAFFHQQSLCVGVCVQKGKRVGVRFKFVFEPKRWYFIAISHEYRFIRSSEVSLFVDAEYSESESLVYPTRFELPLSKCRVGNYEGTHRSQPFFGQLGRVVMLPEVVTRDEAKAIHRLGPNMVTEKKPTDNSVLCGQSGSVFFLSSKRASKILFSFNPKAADGSLLIETASGLRERAAMKMVGLRCIKTNSMQKSLFSVGGLRLFLPLVLQIDLPYGSSSSSAVGEEAALVYNADPPALIQTLNLLAVMSSSAEAQRELLEADIVPMLGYLFTKISPMCWTLDALRALDRFTTVISTNDRLYQKTLHGILLNFDIWIYTSAEVQKELMNTLIGRAKKFHKLMRSCISVQRLCDALRDYYWFEPELDSHAQIPLFHPKSNETIGQRPPESDTRLLRLLILHFARILMTEDPNREDIHALTSYLANVPDHTQCSDVLQLLVSLLSTPSQKRNQSLCEILVSDGVGLWLAVLSRPDNIVRVWVMKVIGSIMEHTTVFRKRREARAVASPHQTAAPIMFFAVKQILQTTEFTVPIYFSLMEILLQNPSINFGRNPVTPTVMQVFQNPEVIPIIFELVCLGSASVSLQLTVLSDFNGLLQRSETNKSVFLTLPHWQSWFLALLSMNHEEETFKAMWGHVVGILTTLLHFTLHEKDGSRHFLELDTLLAHFGDRRLFSTYALRRELNVRLLALLSSDKKLAMTARSEGFVFDNLVHWALWAEKTLLPILPVLPSGSAAHLRGQIPAEFFASATSKRAEGLWTEFGSVQTALEFIDQFWLRKDLQTNIPAELGLSVDSNVSVVRLAELETALTRVVLRFVLFVLNEAENFFVAQKLNEKKSSLSTVQNLVVRPEDEIKSTMIREALSRFVENKLGQWDSERDAMKQCFERNLIRLKRVMSKVKELLGPTVSPNLETGLAILNASRYPFVLSFLFQVMRNSYEHKGLSTEGILSVFKEILSDAKFRFPQYESMLAPMGEDPMLQFVMTQLAFPNAEYNPNLLDHIDRAIRLCLDDEQSAGEASQTVVANHTAQVKEEMQKRVAEENQQAERAAAIARIHLENADTAEANRRLKARHHKEQAKLRLVSKWTSVVRSLHHERGAWKGFDVPPGGIQAWKLDPTEDNVRRRWKLKRNYKFTMHEDAVRNRLGSARSPQPSSSNAPSGVAQGTPPAPASEEEQLLKGLRALDLGAAAAEMDEEASGANAAAAGASSSSASSSSLSSSTVVASNSALMTSSSSVPSMSSTLNSSTASSSSSATASAGREALSTSAAAAELNAQKLAELKDRRALREVFFRCQAQLIGPMSVTCGILELSPRMLFFTPATDASETTDFPEWQTHNPRRKVKKWNVNQIRGIHRRRYLLRRSALEIFFVDFTSTFLNFKTNVRDQLYAKIVSLRPPALVDYYTNKGLFVGLSSPPTAAEELIRSGVTAKWTAREISTFDYLMHLNTFAGRTYNDLTQYPVFPWILADYHSAQLDLDDSSIYRDLSKPVGALNPERLKNILERYECFDDPHVPKFHYGSHYSNPGVVLYYLLRMEPFTTHSLALQDGRFDHSSRLFWSIPVTWENCLSNPADVKELIPEFFYMSDFLRNSNGFSLGVLSDGRVIDDVMLPPWADNSPEKFIRINREALESDYVSENINDWIDLIFGYKQRGQAAADAHNLFFYLTYEGCVNIDAITDPVQRRAIEAQIINFGQTPTQLFRQPHPKRQTQSAAVAQYLQKASQQQQQTRSGGLISMIGRSVSGSPNSTPSTSSPLSNSLSAGGSRTELRMSQPGETLLPGVAALSINPSHATPTSVAPSLSTQPSSYSLWSARHSPLVFVAHTENQILCVHKDGLMTVSSFHQNLPDGKGLPFTFEQDKTVTTPKQRVLDLQFTDEILNMNNCFALTQGGKHLVHCGNWEESLRLSIIATAKELISLHQHLDAVTCLDVSVTAEDTLMVSGSADSTLMVWDLSAMLRQRSGSSSLLPLIGGNSAPRESAIKVLNNADGDGKMEEFRAVHVLRGHDDRVQCVSVSAALDLVASGSADGTCVLHNLRKGTYLRSYELGGSVECVQISTLCEIAAYARRAPGAHPVVATPTKSPQQNKRGEPVIPKRFPIPTLTIPSRNAPPTKTSSRGSQDLNPNSTHTLCLYSVNGRLLAQREVPARILSMRWTREGKYLVCAGEKGLLQVFSRARLHLIHTYNLESDSIRSLAFSESQRFLLCGLDNGRLVIVPVDKQQWIQQTPNTPRGAQQHRHISFSHGPSSSGTAAAAVMSGMGLLPSPAKPPSSLPTTFEQ